MAHAVVTGGSGFLGSHLVDTLLDDKYRVTVLDNHGSGRPANLAHIEPSRLNVRKHDVREPFPEFDDVDVVYHMASRASPDDFDSHAVEIALTNSEGTKNALECAREHDARTVIASTSEVYGNPEAHPQTEEYNGNVNIRGPRAPYDESKRFAEALAVAYRQRYGMDIRTVRIFNTYGPRMRPDDGRVVPNFLSQAISGDDLTVYGDGSQTRSFCFVSDLIEGIRRFADAPAEDAAGEVVNIGNTHEITIRELADIVLEVVDTDSEVVQKPLPQDDPELRCPDISKAREMLDWEPEISISDGLERTIPYFEKQLSLSA
ncbi:NAD-dependent epimerase/dehydratase family protein [Halogeometricum borinquense]|uniref:NAD-dependent epimerase/dehydratase family protein n=1 Tax=Halogeometricum borinquense TaxID=60847 RepID=A0A6C0UFS0_9EURY|nr:NAD-dependent epimerase/dehydratase family protein [Halogeometricum borinquense]QIB74235.1 NAD-dependent epimerase/dehydratase family protein [Halogeometricum borinquense]